jgi:hypothetical protein
VRTDRLAWALLLTVSTASVAMAARAALDVAVASGSLRVCDRVSVQVSARGGESLLWGELQVRVEGDSPWAVVEGPREVAGARPPVWELVLAPLATGDLALPDLGAGVRDSDGEAGVISAAQLPTVSVVSILPPDEEVQPAPLRGPIGVSGFPWEWVLPLAVPLLGLAAALVWWGRRRRVVGVGGAVPALAPYDELAALLDRLDGRVGREPAESICDRMAGGLRRYLGRTSGEPAEDMTSFELRLLARGEEWPDAVQRGIQRVMATADGVRFGRRAIDDGKLRQALETSRETASSLEGHLLAIAEETPDLEAAG